MVTARQIQSAPASWPADLAERDFVVVDLETTGGSAKHDRVIEVAVVRVRDGRVRDRWRSLVNPGISVPPFITGLTGITTGMIARAPTFAELVAPFQRLLGEGILVAHQASFDTGFLRQEFAALGLGAFEPEVLCTLKLSRRLLPGLPSHSLEALIQAFGLPARRQHRALPDALATAELLTRLIDQAVAKGIEDWDDLRQLAAGPKQRRSAGTYERARLKELPDGPGVYLLKDAEGNVFYVGKSVNVRRRVRDHVGGKAEGQPKLRRHLKALADVQAFATGSELEALLLEAKLIKRYLPAANQHLREVIHYPFIRVDVQSEFPRIELTRAPVPDGSLYFGPFRSARLVGGVIDYLRGLFGIRECDRPVLPNGRACLLYELKKCLGPCIGAVTAEEYRPAVTRAVELLRGDWGDLRDGFEAKMEELADRELFEAAAAIRDTLAELRSLVGTQRRLNEMAAYQAVILLPAGPGHCQALFVRGGRVTHQERLSPPVDRRRLGLLCRRVFGGADPGPITQANVDEASILASWIRQHQDDPEMAIIDVDSADLKATLGRLCADAERMAKAHEPASSGSSDLPAACSVTAPITASCF